MSAPTPDRRRPHWLPEEVWLGIVIGEWPVQAFPDQTMAARWAAEDTKRRRVWPVQIPDDVPVSKGEVVPATVRLVGVDA